jgi:hypothetical protein
MNEGAPITAEGPSFARSLKALATVLVAALGVAFARALPELLAAGLPWNAWAVILAALGVIAACWVAMLRSRTGIDDTAIRQRWLWRKQVRLADIAQAKFVAVPHLEWLIAPRLIVRVRGGGVVVFPSADREVMRAFASLSVRGTTSV